MVALGKLWPGAGLLVGRFSLLVADQWVLVSAIFFRHWITLLDAQAIAEEKANGWFQGRMEFGPRALCARSILADARSPRMQRILDLKVKYRESFRPFAPSVRREDASDWFDLEVEFPYMLLDAPEARSNASL